MTVYRRLGLFVYRSIPQDPWQPSGPPVDLCEGIAVRRSFHPWKDHTDFWIWWCGCVKTWRMPSVEELLTTLLTCLTSILEGFWIFTYFAAGSFPAKVHLCRWVWRWPKIPQRCDCVVETERNVTKRGFSKQPTAGFRFQRFFLKRFSDHFFPLLVGYQLSDFGFLSSGSFPRDPGCLRVSSFPKSGRRGKDPITICRGPQTFWWAPLDLLSGPFEALKIFLQWSECSVEWICMF